MGEFLQVLYVEDEADIREVTEFALEGENFDLISCDSGQQALEKARGISPDLILLDVMMPGMDGPTTLSHLRELPHLAATPVIFMTAKVQPAEIDHYKSLGALGIISKPFDATHLADEIRYLLEESALPGESCPNASRFGVLQEKFSNELPERIANIEKAWQAVKKAGASVADAEMLLHCTHSLAGSAGTFGFRCLGERAGELEALLQQKMSQQNTDGTFLPMVDEPVIEQRLAELRALMEQGVDETATIEHLPVHQGHQGEQSPLVYVLEDDLALAGELKQQLRHFDYRVEVFGDSGALSDAYARQLPAVLICDIVFPEGSLAGPKYACELQSMVSSAVPVIYISGRDDWQARLAAVRADGCAYLAKPLDFGALVEQLDKLSGRKREEPFRVLIVEDTTALALYYAGVLEAAGMKTKVLDGPMQLLEVLPDFRPDLILMDIYMPDCSGIEATQVIRQYPVYTNIPIVYLSTEEALHGQMAALKLGGDDFLQKPISEKHLTAAVSIRARRFRELAALMNRDSLTGLLNHINLKLALEQEIARARRNGTRLSFVMIDIDHFKQVNDRYGHQEGDRVIKSLALLISERLRKSDIAARYGGEEFAVILPDTAPQAAATLIDEIRRSFCDIRFSRNFSVNFSAGIAAVPPHSDMVSLIQAADQALYQAKHGGRNRVNLDSSDK